MLQRFLGAVVIFAMCIGFAVSEEIKGRLTKVEGNKITLTVKKDTKEFDLAPGCKACKADDEGKKTEIAEGIKGINVGDKGVNVTITTNADNKVTEVTQTPRKKKV